MAVAFDAVGPSSAGTSGTATTLTWSHTCGASASILLVGVAVGNFSDSGITTAATYNSASMTSVGKIHILNGASGYFEVFYLNSPTTGSAQNVVVTRSGGSGTTTLIGGSMSYSGSSGSPTGTTNAGKNTTSATIAVSSTTGNMAAAFICTADTLSGASQTQRWLNNGGGSANATSALAMDAAGSTSIVFNAFVSDIDGWGAVGVNIPAGGGGGGGGNTVAWVTA